MKKKNLVAMGLAGVMLVGGCVPVLAADNTWTNGGTEPNGEVSVTGNVASSYTIAIPKICDETTLTGNGLSIKSTVNIAENENISISAASEVLNMILSGKTTSDATNNEKYQLTLKVGNNQLSSGNLEIAKYTNTDSLSGEKEVKLTAEGQKTNVKAGVYEGTMIFTVAFDDGKANE